MRPMARLMWVPLGIVKKLRSVQRGSVIGMKVTPSSLMGEGRDGGDTPHRYLSAIFGPWAPACAGATRVSLFAHCLATRRISQWLWFPVFVLLLAVASGSEAVLAFYDLTVIAKDDFETSSYTGGIGWDTGWNVSTAVNIVSTGLPHSGARHLEMRGSAVASRAVDVSDWADVELGFWAKAASLEGDDFVALEVSADGTTWETLETWADGADDNQYHLYEFDKSTQPISDTLWFRFLAQMDDPSDYFYVDDVLVQGEPASINAPASVVTSVPTSPVISTLSASSSGNVVIDGNFSDWAGYPNLADPSGDAAKARGDLSAFSWGNNSNTESNFWMIERYPVDGNHSDDNDDANHHDHGDHGWGGHNDDDDGWDGGHDSWHSKMAKYTIHIDTNNDGNFSGYHDRRVLVDYHPKLHHSNVRVRVKRGSGGQTLYTAEGDWGESIAEGGRKVELAVFWDDLGIASGNVIRMYVESNWDDRLPDSGDIQWSPASVLGVWLLGALLAVGGVALWRIKKRKEQKCLSGLA